MNEKVIERSEHSLTCIFCFRSGLETTFSEEHIIPKSIGGKLVLHQVCSDCNSQLGHEVDTEILKVSGIFRALEGLNIDHDRLGILRSYYNVRAITDEGQRNVRASEEGFEPLPQDMPNGSILTPDDRLINDLRARVHRDERLRSAGLSEATVNDELDKLLETYENCPVGGSVEWPTLGLTLVRRQEKVTIQIQPRDTPQITRFLAKVAYELLFFFGGREFLLNKQVVVPLVDVIIDGEGDHPIYTLRIDPPTDELKPIHVIEFLNRDGILEIYFIFFGRICYRMSAPPLAVNFFDEISSRYNIENIIGLQFQQKLQSGMSFYAVTAEGEYIGLVAIE